MKLTTQQEAEILEAYKNFWIANLSANMKVFSSYLVDDFSIFGSAVGETYFNKTDAVNFYTATADELKDKAQLLNRNISLRPLQADAVVALELSDLYILIGSDWTFYGHARITCVMQKIGGEWKAIHQHASFPDHRTEEGQQLASEKIAEENLVLKEAVQRRTVELEAKNRELEIEAALEKVRAVAMGMSKPADLIAICKAVYEALQSLGVADLRNTLVHTYADEERLFIDYDYSDFTKGHTSTIPYSGNPIIEQFIKDIRASDDAFTELAITGKDLDSWKSFRHANNEAEDARLVNTDALYYYFYSIGTASIGISTFSAIPGTQQALLKRFRNVFDLAYQRYVDITQAAAQARESQIQLALERVRAESSAMQQTSDISKVNQEIFKQLSFLKIDGLTGVAIYLVGEDGMVTVWDLSSPGSMGEVTDDVFRYEPAKTPTLSEFIPIWKAGEPEYFIMDYSEERLRVAVEELEPYYPSMANNFRNAIASGALQHQWNATALITHGVLSLDMMKPPTEEVRSITLRMAAAFNHAHQRFYDLQKAEAQSRESQIQLALERVRARTLAMHKSDELADTASVLFQQIKELGFETWSCGFCIWKDGKTLEAWMGADSGGLLPALMIPYKEEDTHHEIFKAAQKGMLAYEQVWEGKKLQKHYDFLATIPSVKVALDKMKAAGLFLPSKQYYYVGFFNNGYLLLITREPNPLLKEISLRFGNVFQQTYTRFLDLQKAEAQTKEAQLELSLERIRAKVTAMQVSTDLLDIVVTMRTEFVSLGHAAGYFWHMRWLPERYEKAMTDGTGARIGNVMTLPRSMHDPFPGLAAWEKNNDPFIVYAMGPDEAVSYVEKMVSLGDFEQVDPNAPTLDDIRQIGGLTYVIARTTHGEIGYTLNGVVPQPSSDGIATLVRFAAVFDLAYRRFEDLKNSEKRIREAQIELAVERVRAKALAMHNSKQILDVVVTLRNEMLGLDIPGVVAATIYLQDEDDHIRMWDLSSVVEMTAGFQVALDVKFKPEETDPGLFIRRVWKNTANYFVEKQEAADMAITLDWLEQYYPEQAAEGRQFFNTTEWKYILHPTIQLAQGKMSVDILDTPAPPEMESILIKMGAAFDLAYKRFLDLQLSEKQIREAQIELGLERVRARTMAMQHSDELADASVVLDTQVRMLGIQTRGCAFNIYEDGASSEWFASEMGAMPRYKTPREGLFLRYYEAGQRGESIHIESYAGTACKAHYEYLCNIPVMGDALRAMIAAGGAFPEQQVDHAVYFKYGYLLFITLEPVPDAHEIFIRFAKVFEQTYTRFLDLQKAEAQAARAAQDLVEIKIARRKAEDTLVELKETQKQLIQSEKMASLGELTAGIAHEIQNPLNFVNNFSDVSGELIDEMNAELDKGDIQEAKFIAGDIKQNLEKINHHGKRADAIVKGMLQHSRKSEGQKEPTDINALCDEYLRLSYHGLRAKDKSFNVILKTDFDESIGKIKIISQDIGRVIINLLTNSFYATNEKKALRQAQGDNSFEPAVSIKTVSTTSPSGGRDVNIIISDNGNGIPSAIIDKVFQPFFTTKPTGQGTGLGLSLAYDIVKAHGGALKVETVEGEGTVFFIMLTV